MSPPFAIIVIFFFFVKKKVCFETEKQKYKKQVSEVRSLHQRAVSRQVCFPICKV